MIWVAWVTAGTGLVGAAANLILVLRHVREDRARFADHAERIGQLENGGSPVP
jgi:hypothetical protein